MNQSIGLRRSEESDRSGVDLRALCSAVMNDVRGTAAEHGISIEDAQFAREASADPTILRKVLTILLTSEIQRTESGSTLTLLTTPRKTAVEIRIVAWRTPQPDSNASQDCNPRGSSGLIAADTRGLSLLFPLGGSISIDEGPVARTVCLRVPRVNVLT